VALCADILDKFAFLFTMRMFKYTTPAYPISKMVLHGPPTLANPTSTNITQNSAILGGEVTADGGNTITGCGVAFALSSANADPKIDGVGVTNLGTAPRIGVFTVNATGLQAGRSYSFAAYATNSAGTSYSPVGTFTTLGPSAGRAVALETAPAIAEAGHFLIRMVKSIATLPALATVVLLSLIAVVGFFVSKNPAGGDPINYARGLITVLFATGTMAIAFILTVSAILSSSEEFEKRFDKGKDVLTIMIGIFGTILGFYFGTASSPPPTETIRLSLSGPSETISIKKGATATIKISLKQSGGRYAGNVKLSVEYSPSGFKTEFTPDTIRSGDSGDVNLKLIVDSTAKTGTYVLRVAGTPDSGTVSPVDVKIEVVE
jgi:hypothetical protein